MPGMMDKGSDYLGKGRSNGTKSPSNASNGHFSDESGSDDEHGIASNTHTQLYIFIALRFIDWKKNLRVSIDAECYLSCRYRNARGIRLSSQYS